MSTVVEQAIAHHHAGRLAEAEALYRHALAVNSNDPNALYNFGVLAAEVGRADISVDLLRRAAAADPQSGIYQQRLGDMLLTMGRRDEAKGAHERAVHLQPGDAAALCALARALPGDQAIATIRRAIQLQPDSALAHRALAMICFELGRIDDAITASRRAITLDPRDAAAYNILGACLSMQLKDEGIAQLRRAVALDPTLAVAHQNLAQAMSAITRLDEALVHIDCALELDPKSASGYSVLSLIRQRQGMMDDAIAAARKSVELAPNNSISCSNLLLYLHYTEKATPQEIFAEHRRWGERHGVSRAIATQRVERPTNGKLRIGYVSADFRGQSVAHFIEPILANHDREKFEIFCYASSHQNDSVTTRLKRYAHTWRDITQINDDQAAQRIREDQIDILVDLGGHTGNTRLLVFARKPAPIQITYLGYPNTTGLPAMDYRFTDAIADPPGTSDHLHTEKLIRLPRTAWCYQPPTDCPAVQPRPGDGPIIFGAFNILAKFSNTCLALWAEVLAAVPDSKLLIKSKGLGSAIARQRIIDIFRNHNIAEQRLDLRGPDASMLTHLKTHGQVDIMLDPFPYNGTTTTCEALYLGVPVITLMGSTHVARVGASLLANVGLADLVANSPEQYVSIAKSLAADRTRLAQLRSTLRDQMKSSPLMNGVDITRNIEAIYRELHAAR